MKILDGIQVLDLGSFITAPYAAMLLAELGAEVIKVERPESGDPFRAFKGGLYSSQFQAHNRNKRSVALDYLKKDGLAILERLVTTADVVLINVRPGVEAKLNIGPKRLQEINPKLVYCSITGFGSSGPYADRPAFDNVGQALSGWLSMFHQGSDARVAGPAVSDTITGLFATMGILAALVERSSSGQGRHVEVSMLESMIALATEPLAKLFSTGEPASLHSRAAASQSYIVTCKDNQRIGLHLSSPEKFWQGLTRAIDRTDLQARFPTRETRVARYNELASDLAATFASKDRRHWIALLEQHDVPFAPERCLEELHEDPQVTHLNIFYETVHAQHGKIQAANRPIRFDGDNHSNYLPPPTLGEHTDEVLLEMGLSAEELTNLRNQCVI